MNPTDADLIARVLSADDRDAFSALVVRHQSAVRQFLRHLSRGNWSLADDLAQDTFVLAYQSLRRFRGGSEFSTWLLGIAHNHWRNARRRQRDEHPWTDDDHAAADDAATGGADWRQDLAGAMKHLSNDEQLALHLAYRQGLSHGEISTLLDWPLGTVKTHLARAKDKLRQELSVWNPHP